MLILPDVIKYLFRLIYYLILNIFSRMRTVGNHPYTVKKHPVIESFLCEKNVFASNSYSTSSEIYCCCAYCTGVVILFDDSNLTIIENTLFIVPPWTRTLQILGTVV